MNGGRFLKSFKPRFNAAGYHFEASRMAFNGLIWPLCLAFGRTPTADFPSMQARKANNIEIGPGKI
jgi:hypothetical protein